MNLHQALEFKTELASLINKLSLEKDSDTPDFVIAEYLFRALQNYNETVQARTKWASVPKEVLKETKFSIDVSGLNEDEIKALLLKEPILGHNK